MFKAMMVLDVPMVCIVVSMPLKVTCNRVLKAMVIAIAMEIIKVMVIIVTDIMSEVSKINGMVLIEVFMTPILNSIQIIFRISTMIIIRSW